MDLDFKPGKSVILRVKRSGGIYQRVVFKMILEKKGNINYKLLKASSLIDFNELVRLAKEVNLPVASGPHIVFPRGKEAHDFEYGD